MGTLKLSAQAAPLCFSDAVSATDPSWSKWPAAERRRYLQLPCAQVWTKAGFTALCDCDSCLQLRSPHRNHSALRAAH